MSFIDLKKIGKIYVSEGNVAVGIRGIDLSFDKGELIAVTGKSGSGKSTLLNVISGIDTYEEGELYIEGKPTSHYRQEDWEDYRRNYISFIFQEYNIIDSFTVLQNVELALTNIPDPKKRRARALELIKRVGMEKYIRSRGSKLSGGQKQRTVIARALAKDSPVILADEPTGNLDSATSKEIIDLLYEVSADKLLIMVTHDFDEVKDYATREIRIYDGEVEFDKRLAPVRAEASPSAYATGEITAESGAAAGEKQKKKKAREKRLSALKNGVRLGMHIFTAKPRLTFFMCLLMAVGAVGIFFTTASLGGSSLSTAEYMFNHVDGRVVIVKESGELITDDDLNALTGDNASPAAKSYLKCDYLLDQLVNVYYDPLGSDDLDWISCIPAYGEKYSGVMGRYPEKDDEVLLYIPISQKPSFGERLGQTVNFGSLSSNPVTVVGICYFYDNTKKAKALFTEQGFITQTAIKLDQDSSYALNIYQRTGGVEKQVTLYKGKYDNPFIIPYHSEEKKIYMTTYNGSVSSYASEGEDQSSCTFSISLYGNGQQMTMPVDEYVDWETTIPVEIENKGQSLSVYVSTALIRELTKELTDENYKQASLFYANDMVARNAAKTLRESGYVAISSDTKYDQENILAVLNVLGAAFSILLWIGMIIFFAFFINLCTGRAVAAFRPDMAIMRSMGISVKEIRIGISLIPSLVIVAGLAVALFTIPETNAMFTFLHLPQYLILFAGLMILTLRITKKQIKKLFGVSVKKSIKGGDAA